MFLVNQQAQNALGCIKALHTLHSTDPAAVRDFIAGFMATHFDDVKPDLLITGENGDSRLLPFYTIARQQLPADAAIARFKHLSGEYPSAASFGLWLALAILQNPRDLQHLITGPQRDTGYENIILYNCYKGEQHSIIRISKK
jgi:hypothetical protein